jgi:hypothetical protein
VKVINLLAAHRPKGRMLLDALRVEDFDPEHWVKKRFDLSVCGSLCARKRDLQTNVSTGPFSGCWS